MAKSFKTVYFKSENLLEAERQGLNVNLICDEALKLAVNRDLNKGTEAGEMGQYLDKQVLRQKNLKAMQKLSRERNTPMGQEKFTHNLRLYCIEYGLELNQGLKEIGC